MALAPTVAGTFSLMWIHGAYLTSIKPFLKCHFPSNIFRDHLVDNYMSCVHQHAHTPRIQDITLELTIYLFILLLPTSLYCSASHVTGGIKNSIKELYDKVEKIFSKNR